MRCCAGRIRHGPPRRLRISAFNTGAVAVIAGMLGRWWPVVLAGGIVVGAVAPGARGDVVATVAHRIARPLRRHRAVLRRRDGVWRSTPDSVRRWRIGALGDIHERFVIAHAAVNLFGWAASRWSAPWSPCGRRCCAPGLPPGSRWRPAAVCRHCWLPGRGRRRCCEGVAADLRCGALCLPRRRLVVCPVAPSRRDPPQAARRLLRPCRCWRCGLADRIAGFAAVALRDGADPGWRQSRRLAISPHPCSPVLVQVLPGQ